MKTKTVYGTVLRCTAQAFQFQLEDEAPVWVPFSQLQDPDEKYVREGVGQEMDIEIPLWLAEANDL